MIQLLLLACAVPEAEPGSVVLVDDDQSEPWDVAYEVADDVGGLFPMEAVVVGPDGLPAAGVRVSVLSGWDGATVRVRQPGAGLFALDVRSNEVVELGACSTAPSGCTWLELITSSEGKVNFAVFVDVAPDSGASVPVFITAGDDVASVELEFADAVVVH